MDEPFKFLMDGVGLLCCKSNNEGADPHIDERVIVPNAKGRGLK